MSALHPASTDFSSSNNQSHETYLTHDVELVLTSAAEPNLARILTFLDRGGRCVCQMRAVLDLAPSTASKHLTILKHAGVVQDQRDGKWIESP